MDTVYITVYNRRVWYVYYVPVMKGKFDGKQKMMVN